MEFLIVHLFEGFDGEGPLSLLMKASDGALYGTAYRGGAHGRGVVFRFQPPGSFEVLHNFSGDPDDKRFYNADGAYPCGGLIQASDGYLYGTTYGGGAHLKGTVFRIQTNGYGYEILHSFGEDWTLCPITEKKEDGAHPTAGVMMGKDGVLYGAAAYGGDFECGIVFRLNPDGSGYQILHTFTGGSGGAYPHSALLQGKDGALYGTTTMGGANDQGVEYRINPDGSGFEVIRHLKEGPWDARARDMTAVVQASDGGLYGTKHNGGAPGKGVIYKIINPFG